MAERDEDTKAAEREYRAAVAKAPDEPRARVALANLLSSQKRWSEARAVFTEQLARKPDDARSLYQLGKLAALSGEELALGLESIDRYLAQGERPDELPEYAAHWRRGLVLEKMGRKDEALAALRKSVQLDPKAEAPRKDLKRLGG
jgi:tetratricopeptide (TPR) repeat protein